MPEVTDEQVETAAEAMYLAQWPAQATRKPWRTLPEWGRDQWRKLARAALAAAGEADQRDTGIGLIAAERRRQIEKGYDAAHDAQHSVDDLVWFAYTYLHTATRSTDRAAARDGRESDREACTTAMVRAGALIAAALDRVAAAGERP